MKNKEHTTCKAATGALAHDLIARLRDAKETNIPTLLLYSGGSNLAVFDQLPPNLHGPHLTVCALDDRFDPTGKHNNAAHFMARNWYDQLLEHGTHFINTRVHEGEDVGAWTLRTREAIDAWLTHAREPKTILATMGVGADGHIAGILPMANEHRFHELFSSPEHYASYEVSNEPFSHRLTATTALLDQITHGFVLACGKDDVRVITENKNAPVHKVPAHILHTLPVAVYFGVSID